MFLRILSFVISAAVVAYVEYELVAFFETSLISPMVCTRSLRVAQDYIMENGRGYFERPVNTALGSECFIRTMMFVGFDLLLVMIVAILVPSSWAFWVVPAWAIKVGMILGLVVNAFVDFVISGNTASYLGLLESVDDGGVGHFKGVWSNDFDADMGAFRGKDDFPPVGRKYIVLYYLGFFCAAPVDYN